MTLSIIIPTLNEEKFLPLLLASLKNQDFRDFEVIVSDPGSKDRTKEIVLNYGYKIVGDGKGVGKGRNNGAREAKGEIFLFLDADVVLEKDFLEENIKEFEGRKLGVATCYAQPISKNILDKLYYSFANFWVAFFQYFKPFAHGFCIFIKKDLHQKIQGFDETIIFGEDSDYVERAGKIEKFRILKSKKVLVSARRFEKEGRLKLALKYIFFNLYRIFVGEIRKEIIKYW